MNNRSPVKKYKELNKVLLQKHQTFVNTYNKHNMEEKQYPCKNACSNGRFYIFLEIYNRTCKPMKNTLTNWHKLNY